MSTRRWRLAIGQHLRVESILLRLCALEATRCANDDGAQPGGESLGVSQFRQAVEGGVESL